MARARGRNMQGDSCIKFFALALWPFLIASAVVSLAQAQEKGQQEEAKDDDSTMAQKGQERFAPKAEPLASWNGLRPKLEKQGLSFAFTYLSDTQGTFYNGGRDILTYFGRAEGVVDADLEKIAGLKGATMHVGGFYLHGQGLGRSYIGAEAPPSDLEGRAHPRLNDFWFEQKFGGGWTARLGKLAADSESFFFIPAAAFPVGSAFGWPPMMTQNLPSGGPGYPFAWMGAKIRYDHSEDAWFQAAIFDGNGAGPGFGDPQDRDPNGLKLRIKDPPFVIAEIGVKTALPIEASLSGQFRLGGWTHFGRFDDMRRDVSGRSMALPESVGAPMRHRGDWGIYITLEQQIWRGADEKSDITIWNRSAYAPSDRNFINFYFDGGVNFNGLISARPKDKFGVAANFAHVSPQVSRLDEESILLGANAYVPRRDYELTLAANYTFEIEEGFALQPNFQAIIHPGDTGRFTYAEAGRRAKPSHAFLGGLRTVLKY